MKELVYSDRLQHSRFEQEEEQLMNLADNMAAAASMFSAHGYDNFITSRQTFRESLHKHFLEFIRITNPN